jgi:lysophospholipase L1-like esterase
MVDATLRQTIKVGLAAPTIRLQISNAFGGSDLPVTAVAVALAANNTSGLSAVVPGSSRPVTFSAGSASTTIPNGAVAFSDPIADFSVSAGAVLSVTIYLERGQTTNLITGHPGSRTTSFLAAGNQVAKLDLADTGVQKTDHWYFLSTVSGWLPDTAGAIAIIGDSITDGRGSTTNANDRWPDVLQARLLASPATSNIAVINVAAGGNRILADGLGPNVLARLERDVLARPSARYALLFEGVNDIGTGAVDAASQNDVGTRLIAAYEQIITRLHAARIPVFGATITALSGPGQGYSDAERERTRQRVNKWSTLTSGGLEPLSRADKADLLMLQSESLGGSMPSWTLMP